MSLQSVIDSFKNILNRDDMTDAQAQTFVLQGISRIQRDCRLPSMERTLIITPETATNMFVVPTDLIQPIDVLVQDQTGTFYPLVKKAFRDATKVSATDLPRVYARVQTTFYIFGSVPIGRQIMFLYYSAQAWEGRYQAIKTEVMAMAIDLDAEGGPQYVQSLYNDMEPNW